MPGFADESLIGRRVELFCRSRALARIRKCLAPPKDGAPAYDVGTEPAWGDRVYESKIHDYYGVGPHYVIAELLKLACEGFYCSRERRLIESHGAPLAHCRPDSVGHDGAAAPKRFFGADR
jgi:hypothetical protein